MEPAITGQKTMGHDERSVHNWRVSQLTHLGIPGTLAEIYADRTSLASDRQAGSARLPPAARPAHRPVMPTALTRRDDRGRELARTPPAATSIRTCSSPIDTTGPALRQIQAAKRICRTCPAQPARACPPGSLSSVEDRIRHAAALSVKAITIVAAAIGALLGVVLAPLIAIVQGGRARPPAQKPERPGLGQEAEGRADRAGWS